MTFNSMLLPSTVFKQIFKKNWRVTWQPTTRYFYDITKNIWKFYLNPRRQRWGSHSHCHCNLEYVLSHAIAECPLCTMTSWPFHWRACIECPKHGHHSWWWLEIIQTVNPNIVRSTSTQSSWNLLWGFYAAVSQFSSTPNPKHCTKQFCWSCWLAQSSGLKWKQKSRNMSYVPILKRISTLIQHQQYPCFCRNTYSSSIKNQEILRCKPNGEKFRYKIQNCLQVPNIGPHV